MPRPVMSALRLAGQRCSAMRLLVVGNTSDLTTDVDPVVDQDAFQNIQKHIQRLKSVSKVLLAQEKPASVATKTIANLIALHASDEPSIAAVRAEIFGPALPVERWVVAWPWPFGDEGLSGNVSKAATRSRLRTILQAPTVAFFVSIASVAG